MKYIQEIQDNLDKQPSNIYKQATKGPCAYYAILVALQKMGVQIDEKGIFDVFKRFDPHLSSVFMGANELKRLGIIRTFEVLETVHQIDYHLMRGFYLPTYTVNNLSFDSVRNPPFIQQWNGTLDHAFVITPKKIEGMWKIQDSQGPNFADGGYWYIKKEDFVGKRKFAPPIRFFL